MDLPIDGLVDAQEIGFGGFSTVYRARQVRFNRVVAVKLINARLDDAGRARFERECQTLGMLSAHPSIVTVFDSGITSDGHGYLVLEYCSGGSLAARVATIGPLGWEKTVSIGIKLAGALATAHGHGVLHRDVKPENVLLTGFGEPALADFGIARMAGGWQTASGFITASIVHAAPEVLSGEPGSEFSDQWSLASTMWQATSGSPPFADPADETLTPLIARILTQPPRGLPTDGVPQPVVEVLLRALSKAPHDRYPTMLAFAEALQSIEVTHGQTPTPLVVASGAVASAAMGVEPEEAIETRAVVRRSEPSIGVAPAEPPSETRVVERAVASATASDVAQDMPDAGSRRRRRPRLAAVALVAALIAVAAGGFALLARGSDPTSEGDARGTDVSPTAIATDAVSGFRFQPDMWTVPAGEEFRLTMANTDAIAHNLTVLRSPIADESEMYRDAWQEFDESLAVLGTGDVAAGETGIATGALEPGVYQVVCTIPGHFAAGMRGILNVETSRRDAGRS